MLGQLLQQLVSLPEGGPVAMGHRSQHRGHSVDVGMLDGDRIADDTGQVTAINAGARGPAVDRPSPAAGISLTLGTYSHVAPELAEDAARRNGDALWG